MPMPLADTLIDAPSDMSFDMFNCVRAPIFVLQIDSSQRPVYVAFNDSACEAAGLNVSDVLGQTAVDIYGGRFGALAYARHLQAIWSGRPLSYELTLPLQNQERTVRTTLEPILDDAGDVAYLFGTSSDISDLQKLHETHVEAETFARELEATFDQAAYDLRAPMRQISDVIELLRVDFLDHKDGKLDLINKLGEIALNAQTLIADLLSQVDVARRAENENLVEFEDLCTKILVMLDPMGLHQAHIEPGVLHVDQTALQIALRTLLDYLFHDPDEERKLIAITAEAVSEDMLQFTVRDYGFGFDAEAHRILGKRGDAGLTKFGLHGVRRLIKARGGVISIHEPEDGPGALVKFTLPGKIVQTATENA